MTRYEDKAPPQELRKTRRPLAQRVALHAAKTLVTEHPGAALHVAGASASYAVKSLAQDGLDMVHEGLDAVISRVEHMAAAISSPGKDEARPLEGPGASDDQADT